MNDPVEQSDEKTQTAPVRSEKKNGARLRFVLFILGFCLLLLLLYKTGWINVFLDKEEAKAFLESLGPARFIVFVILQVAQVVFAPIPGEVTGVLGGYFFGFYWGVILSTIGLTIGSFIAFSLSRYFGRPLVEKVVDQAVLAKFDYLLEHKGVFVAFMLFLVPGFPKDYLCFVLGLGHLTALEFLVVSTVGRLFGTILLTLSGGYIEGREYGKLVVLVCVAIGATIVAYLFRDRIECLLKNLQCKKS